MLFFKFDTWFDSKQMNVGFDGQDGHDGHNSFCSRLRGKALLKDLYDCRSLTNNQADRTLQCKEICNGGPWKQY